MFSKFFFLTATENVYAIYICVWNNTGYFLLCNIIQVIFIYYFPSSKIEG